MNQDVQAALDDWKFIRSNTIDIINGLGNTQLRVALPRPGLDTFAKHFEEMVEVQRCYVNAIETKRMDFSSVGDNNSFDGESSVDALLTVMTELDEKLEEAVSNTPDDVEIDWGDEGTKLLSSHISNLSIHETLHIGQIIAFCYVTNVNLPETLIQMWGLSEQE